VSYIPFNRPFAVGTEYEYIRQAIDNMHCSGDGPFTKRCQQLLERELGAAKVLLTTSCTDALEMSALLLEIGPGDEVIVPSFTFVSTANAFALRGARIVFADIRPDTLNLDEARLEALITPRTRAIVVVHYAGVGCEMDAILDIARRHQVPVVEDNAHGLFGKYRGQPLGSLGCLATQSFHETKNITCGEGGALVINDPQLIPRAEILREKGTDRSRFFRGEVDKYTWVDVGSSFLPSDMLAAFLFAQLEVRQEIQARRRRIWQTYHWGLRDWAALHEVRLPAVPEYCEQSHHMFYLLMPSFEAREAMIEHLRREEVNAVFHYLPLHLSPMGRRFDGQPAACPVAEQTSACLLRLPFFNGLSPARQEEVIGAVCRAKVSRSSLRKAG
jgi:dTDP-4-amino-4,6-dideoxygalactose transaminase